MTEQVRIGLIGTSYWADGFYLPCLKSHAGAVTTAICGRNRSRAEELAAKHGMARVYTDYREMIESRELDAVIVATPEDLHHPMTMAALEAGLHVLCEKPLALTVAEAREMFEKAEAIGVKHMVQFNQRWLPHYRFVKCLLDEDYIGQPYHAYFHWPAGWGRHQSVDRYYWYYDPQRAHGAVSEMGSHFIDLARWYLGDITRVIARLSTFISRPGPDGSPIDSANDSAFLIVEFASGAQASMHLTTANLAGRGLKHTGQVMILHGREGTLETRCDPWTEPLVSEILGLRPDAEQAEMLSVPDEYFGDADRNDPFNVFQKQSIGPRLFVDAILNDLPVSPNFYDGYKVQQVIEAAIESDRTDCAVTIDHTQE